MTVNMGHELTERAFLWMLLAFCIQTFGVERGDEACEL